MSEPMNPRELRGAALLMAAFFLLGLSSTVVAQDESVHPGINESFVERDLDRWIERFEGEDRDLYKRRTEVMAVLELEPGMAVADIGAGTGFFSMLFAREVGPAGKVYALDITPKFIDHIEKTAAELGLDNVESRLNPVDSTGLEENSVETLDEIEARRYERKRRRGRTKKGEGESKADASAGRPVPLKTRSASVC